jgi:hypothetical protein
MARRKKAKRRPRLYTRRRRSNPIGRIMKRRSPNQASTKTTVMDAVTVGAGLVAGQWVGRMLDNHVAPFKDAKLRGAALAAVGILGAKYMPKGLKGVALGVAASGVYQIAKEVMPNTIAGTEIGQLSPADVELIENMALESELSGLEDSVAETVTGGMDAEILSTVTGADDDDDDESDY